MEKRKNIKKLRPQSGKKNNPELVYGKRAIEEVFAAHKTFERIFLQKDLKGEFVKEVKEKARDNRTPISLVPIEKLNRLTRRNHQGVVGFISLIEYSSIHHVISRCFDEGKSPIVLVLDQITDVRNIGSIARSAECAGVDAIILPMQGSGQINSDAMKTSAGALNHIEVCKESNLFETCQYLKNSGLQLLACSEKGDQDYFDMDLTIPTVFLLGSEDIGISGQLLKIADGHAKIPMHGKIESLNVSNAAAVLLFEANRQRLKS